MKDWHNKFNVYYLKRVKEYEKKSVLMKYVKDMMEE
jgi:hypothetical protein